MRDDLHRKGNVVPVGSREWLQRLREGQGPAWNSVPPAAAVTDKLPILETMRQFYREIGRRGRLERSRRFARRSVSGWTRFCRRYGSSPKDVISVPVRASREVLEHLCANARRGGQARARKYTPEQLKAWAAMGGRAKAANRRQASSPAPACTRQAAAAARPATTARASAASNGLRSTAADLCCQFEGVNHERRR